MVKHCGDDCNQAILLPRFGESLETTLSKANDPQSTWYELEGIMHFVALLIHTALTQPRRTESTADS